MISMNKCIVLNIVSSLVDSILKLILITKNNNCRVIGNLPHTEHQSRCVPVDAITLKLSVWALQWGGKVLWCTPSLLPTVLNFWYSQSLLLIKTLTVYPYSLCVI